MGSAYEDAGRLEDATTLTRYALLLAQESNTGEQIYRWEWQLGRILLAAGDRAAAGDIIAA